MEQIPVCYGRQVRNAKIPRDSRGIAEATRPEGDAVRRFVQTWENPRPEVEIQSLDFVSNVTACASLLLAIPELEKLRAVKKLKSIAPTSTRWPIAG